MDKGFDLLIVETFQTFGCRDMRRQKCHERLFFCVYMSRDFMYEVMCPVHFKNVFVFLR